MKYFLFLIITFSILLGCSKEKKVITNSETTQNDSSTVIIEPIKEPKATEDTTLNSAGIRILIYEEQLESYVSNEYENDGGKKVDKYFDKAFRLVIKISTETTLDTTFNKQSFQEFTSEDFLQIALLNNLWFREMENEKLEFFGVITKPETDWSFAFYLRYNIVTEQIEIEEHIDEEI